MSKSSDILEKISIRPVIELDPGAYEKLNYDLPNDSSPQKWEEYC